MTTIPADSINFVHPADSTNNDDTPIDFTNNDNSVTLDKKPYSSKEMQSVYSATTTDWAIDSFAALVSPRSFTFQIKISESIFTIVH